MRKKKQTQAALASFIIIHVHNTLYYSASLFGLTGYLYSWLSFMVQQ